MAMTLADLIQMADDYGYDPEQIEIRIMSQPRWPFEYSVKGSVFAEVLEWQSKYRKKQEHVLYLCEGSQLGYGSKDAWEECY